MPVDHSQVRGSVLPGATIVKSCRIYGGSRLSGAASAERSSSGGNGTFNRLIDDYAFHDFVRPELNAALDAEGIADHTYLLPLQAASIAQLDRAALWNKAQWILPQLYSGYHIAAIDITLPWSRTFETEIDASLAPNL